MLKIFILHASDHVLVLHGNYYSVGFTPVDALRSGERRPSVLVCSNAAAFKTSKIYSVKV